MIEIPENDKALNEQDQNAVNRLIANIVSQLKNESTAYVYSFGERYARIVGAMFKKKGYHVAYDYVGCKFRNIMVSKHTIGESRGRLVSRSWE